MARGDFKLHNPSEDQFSTRAIVASGAVQSINAGEPTISANATAASWTGAVKIAADADPTTASGHRFTGIAKSDSSETASVNGYVEVWVPDATTVYSGKAKTASLANTQALIDGLKFKRVIFDLTGTSWTVDTAAADALANGVVCLGGDAGTSTIYFLVIPSVSIMGATN